MRPDRDDPLDLDCTPSVLLRRVPTGEILYIEGSGAEARDRRDRTRLAGPDLDRERVEYLRADPGDLLILSAPVDSDTIIGSSVSPADCEPLRKDDEDEDGMDVGGGFPLGALLVGIGPMPAIAWLAKMSSRRSFAF